MIVRAGPVLHHSALGVLHLDRQLDAAQLSLVVAALQAIGWAPRLVSEIELDEGGALVRSYDEGVDGERIVRRDEHGRILIEQRVRRVRFGGSAAKICHDESERT